MEIKAIFERMTLREKAQLLSGKGNWFFNGIERLSIRDFIVSDGPHGIRAYSDYVENFHNPKHKVPATAFPSASCMASTWNPDLIFRVGETIAKECNHYSVDVLLGPGVNGKRSPLGGRNFEYYSEDPVLTAEIGTAFVKGVQSQGVGTSLKHFVLNEQESSRRFISSMVDETTFRELYAYPFEKIIKKANPLTVMASYNRINDVYACENKDLLTTLLRDEWGYEGLAISDWGGVQHKKESILAGLDIEMPESEFVQPFIDDVVSGVYPIEVIDQAVWRILKAYQWMLDNPNHGKKTDFEENHGVAQAVANEGIVLLKNDHNVLPLKKEETVLILGDYAVSPKTTGGGSAELLAYKTESPLDFIKPYGDVHYFDLQNDGQLPIDALKSADKVVIFTGTTTAIEHEGDDRTSLSLPEEQLHLIDSVLSYNKNVIVVNNSGSAIDVQPFIHRISAFVQAWFLGSASGKAIADILYGSINPSGRLSESFPISLKNTPTYPNFPGTGDRVYYNEGLQTGYRFYNTHGIDVQFPFGFGLSYSSFSYGKLTVSSITFSPTQPVTLHFPITNTSEKNGYEVIQVYVHSTNKKMKCLKTFKKVFVPAHETVMVDLPLTEEAFEQFDSKSHQWVVYNGTYEICVGTSIEAIIDTALVTVESFVDEIEPLNVVYPFKRWINHPNLPNPVKELLKTTRSVRHYEYEEPFDRIIRRLMRERQLSSQEIHDFLEMINKML